MTVSHSTEEVPGWVGLVTFASVALVAVAAAVVSVEHLATLARLAGESHNKSWLLPASVDGLVVASTMTLFRAQRTRQPAGWVPWVSLIGGLVTSVVGNVVAVHPDLADPSTLKVAVGATPPIALAAALHQGLGQMRQTTVASEPAPEPQPEPQRQPEPVAAVVAVAEQPASKSNGATSSPPTPASSTARHAASQGDRPRPNEERAEALLPLARQIRAAHGNKLSRAALGDELRLRGEKVSTANLVVLQRALRAEAGR